MSDDRTFLEIDDGLVSPINVYDQQAFTAYDCQTNFPDSYSHSSESSNDTVNQFGHQVINCQIQFCPFNSEKWVQLLDQWYNPILIEFKVDADKGFVFFRT